MINQRARLYAFIICILISSVLWLLIKLSNNFKDTAIYPLVIKSPIHNKIIVNQPYNTVAITSKTQGFKISFANYFTKKKPIVVNLSKIKSNQKMKMYIRLI